MFTLYINFFGLARVLKVNCLIFNDIFLYISHKKGLRIVQTLLKLFYISKLGDLFIHRFSKNRIAEIV